MLSECSIFLAFTYCNSDLPKLRTKASSRLKSRVVAYWLWPSVAFRDLKDSETCLTKASLGQAGTASALHNFHTTLITTYSIGRPANTGQPESQGALRTFPASESQPRSPPGTGTRQSLEPLEPNPTRRAVFPAFPAFFRIQKSKQLPTVA